MKGKVEMTESQTASRAETAGSQDAVGPQGEGSQTAGVAGSGHPDSGLWKSLLPSLAGLPSLQANDQTQGISAGAWVQIPAQPRCAWKVWASCIPPRAPVFLTCNEGCNSFARGLLGPRNELKCFEQGLAQSEGSINGGCDGSPISASGLGLGTLVPSLSSAPGLLPVLTYPNSFQLSRPLTVPQSCLGKHGLMERP